MPTWTTGSLLAVLDTLEVVPERLRVGYDRALFPHWNDTNGSGCHARQDALLAQVIGFPQRDLFDPCVVVEGDWFSLFDGALHAGSPGDVDVDHVVALAEAWDSGADAWPLELRRAFANDPINLLVVSRSSNQSKGDKDAGEWRPPRREAWCVTATIMIHTKSRYGLTVDGAERDGLAAMAATCDEEGQWQVPGLPLPGTPAFDALPPVTIPPATTPPPTSAEVPRSSACGPGQVDINSASEAELTRIIHIGPERAAQLVALRPFTSVRQLTRINGIGDGRIRDILAEGIACV